jgi:hypothetical protein
MSYKEIKGTLARLLATENLIIEHKKVSTASFDVKRRVLTLPNWERASVNVYDLLVGHEVGHALYTPVDGWEEIFSSNIPKDFVNIVEDARIEKLMKRKFPGLAKTFFTGYQELNRDDFFGIKETDLSTMSLIDRINLFYKIGLYSDVPFSEDEQHFIELIDVCETFEDVIEICKQICDYIKEHKKDSVEIPSDVQTQQQSGSGDSIESDSQPNSEQKSDSENKSEEGEGESTSGYDEEAEPSGQDESGNDGLPIGGDLKGEGVSKTQSNFDKMSETLIDKFQSDDVYIELPDVDLSKVIIDNDKLTKHITRFYSNYFNTESLNNVDEEYKKFKKESQKEVNYLVKEFECKKSADAYQRIMLNKTGVLDTSKLHTYKYNEDLFRKVAVVPEGKNHGMIFILDWSGSMAGNLVATVKQLMNLCWFCRKTQIPFEVYAFTNEWHYRSDSSEPCHKEKEFTYKISNYFSLLNFVTSKVNNSKFEESMLNLWRSANAGSGNICCPAGIDLSGTPLNDTIVVLNSIIPEFKNKNKIQKTNVVILTDGESNMSTYNTKYNETYATYSVRKIIGEERLRDRKTGKVYRSFDYKGLNTFPTYILLDNLKDRNPDVNIIGFRIGSNYEFRSFYKNYYGECTSECSKMFSKNKSFEFTDTAYDALYFLASNELEVSTQFEVEEDATPADIGKAFRSMLKNKKTNKKVLSSFASLIS